MTRAKFTLNIFVLGSITFIILSQAFAQTFLDELKPSDESIQQCS